MSNRIASVYNVEAIEPTDDAVTIIAKLRVQVQQLEERLDQVQKWGHTGWKRWGIVQKALEESGLVEQEV